MYSEEPPLNNPRIAPVIATQTPAPVALVAAAPVAATAAASPELSSSELSSSGALGSSNASEPSSPSEAIDLKLVPLRTNISIEKYVDIFLKNFICDDPLNFISYFKYPLVVSYNLIGNF
jgi:hypothetical protein